MRTPAAPCCCNCLLPQVKRLTQYGSKFHAWRLLHRNTYTTLNALAGHFNSFGNAQLLPKKRFERAVKVRAACSERLSCTLWVDTDRTILNAFDLGLFACCRKLGMPRNSSAAAGRRSPMLRLVEVICHAGWPIHFRDGVSQHSTATSRWLKKFFMVHNCWEDAAPMCSEPEGSCKVQRNELFEGKWCKPPWRIICAYST